MNPVDKLRELKFQRLSEINEELDRLLDRGYTARGKWSLAQICGHLQQWMAFPMDGFPPAPWPLGIIFWAIRTTSGKRQLAKVLRDGFKPGIPTNPATVPVADAVDDAEAVASLKETIARFDSFDGPIHPSPIFGDLDYATLEQLQLAHCAHHLRFLVPN